jgi:hypothetical protein
MHGVGGARDLPIPASLAIAGAVAALVVSFGVLALAWRRPRFEDSRSGRAVPALQRIVDSAWFVALLRAFGLLLFAYTIWAAVWGQDLLINPIFGMFYILLWVGIVPASLVLGPVWKAISPVRTLHLGLSRLAGTDPDRGILDYPARLGYWPGALGLFAFVWMELVSPDNTSLSAVRLWIAVWAAVLVVGGAIFGQRWFARADPFEVYSTLVSHLSVWGRRDGALVVRNPLANLSTITPAPGLVAVVAVLFGSTAFDSFRESPRWILFLQEREMSPTWPGFALLITMCVLVGLIIVGGTMATGVGDNVARRDLPMLFAHSIVPIIVGYIFAHYLRYLVEVGTQTLIQMSDPMSNGTNLFGTADWQVNYWLSDHPTFVAVTKVLGVVVGHVLGVVAAHDRAVALLPRKHQVTGQLSLLAAMLMFTAGGLYLLFSS